MDQCAFVLRVKTMNARIWVSLSLVAATVFSGAVVEGNGAVIDAGDESSFRAAVAAAQPGDTVLLTNRVELASTVRIEKPLTITASPQEAWRTFIFGSFEGVLLKVVGKGVIFEWAGIGGSPQTDGLDISEAEGDVVMRDLTIYNCRNPVLDTFWESRAALRLERVTATRNRYGLGSFSLDATDSVFSFNGGTGVGAYNGRFDRCRIENNHGDGMGLLFGTVKNSVFRYNSDLGLRFDPDPGVLTLSGCLFYANAGGGILLREEAFATVDNCTFTRHTGAPAIVVTEATDVLFRHCTVVDNVFIEPENWHLWYAAGGAFVIHDSGRVELQNCVVADNPTNGAPHAAGLVTAWSEWIDGGGNVIGGPALLSALSDNGGPTLSLMPLPESPVIDAGRASDLVADARGLSREAGAAPDAGAIERDAGPVAESDEDGLPDLWERFHDLDPNDDSDAASDGDRDGQSALEEFRSGTDPSDAKSVHRLKGVTISPSPSLREADLQIGALTWNVERGVTYEVETSADLREWRRLTQPGYLYREEDGRLVMWIQLLTAEQKGFFRVIAK
jgi:hypothetical protein